MEKESERVIKIQRDGYTLTIDPNLKDIKLGPSLRKAQERAREHLLRTGVPWELIERLRNTPKK